jgi:hypothetical protein
MARWTPLWMSIPQAVPPLSPMKTFRIRGTRVRFDISDNFLQRLGSWCFPGMNTSRCTASG